MDLRTYYRNLREVQAAMPAHQVVMVSLATPDGGKPNTITEVPTPIAARMVIEGSARQATEEEAAGFHDQQTLAKKIYEEAAAASKLQVVVVTAGQLPVRAGKEQ